MEKNSAYSNFDSIIKERSNKTSKPLSISKTYPAFIILAVLLLISFFVYYIVDRQISKELQSEYDQSVTSVMTRLNAQFNSKYEIVESMSALYDVVIEVVRDYFDLYASVPVKSYPSILSIEYIEKVRDADIGTYTFFVSSQGYPQYAFKRTEKKDYYYAIHHILPYETNVHRHGMDISSQKEFFEPAMKSVFENKIVTTENYVSRSNDTSSFYIIAPIYIKDAPRGTVEDRIKNNKGFLALELNTKTYYNMALTGEKLGKKISNPNDSLIYFKIVDNNNNKEKIIYQSANYASIPNDFEPMKQSVVEYKLADRELKVHFATVPNFGGTLRKNIPIITLIVSLILNFLFFAFILSVITSRARALAIADRITESQRRIVDASRDVIGVFDADGNWLSANNATFDIFKKEPNSILKTSVFDLSADNSSELNQFFDKIKTSNKNFNDRITTKMISGTQNKWVNWNLSYVKDDNLVYVTGRDITLEKIAEEEALLKTKQIQLAEMYALEASESKTFFMKKLSHQLRNSLTGITGYLQLLSNKLYDTPEEMDSYVQMAEQSSEEIFEFVSETVDAALNVGKATDLKLELVKVGEDMLVAHKQFVKNKNNESKLNISNESLETRAIADNTVLLNMFCDTFSALSSNGLKPIFDTTIQEKTTEGMTEIKIKSPSNIEVKQLIDIYQKYSTEIVNHLDKDQNDFIYRLSNIASICRRLNGIFDIEYLGEKDGLLTTFKLQRNKQVE